MNQDASDPSPARHAGGRPLSPSVARTSLDGWVVTQGITSQAFSDLCRAKATELGIDEAHVPARKSVDDMRAGRYYPGLSAAWIIHEVTAGAVGLPQWARDQARVPGRKRAPKT